jgi:predicted  nucleic acid-binding Zn-ribbon protein
MYSLHLKVRLEKAMLQEKVAGKKQQIIELDDQLKTMQESLSEIDNQIRTFNEVSKTVDTLTYERRTAKSQAETLKDSMTEIDGERQPEYAAHVLASLAECSFFYFFFPLRLGITQERRITSRIS